jgi:hypothetical protein
MTRTAIKIPGSMATHIQPVTGVMRAMRRMTRDRYCLATSGSARSAAKATRSRYSGGTDIAPLPGSLSCDHITLPT